MLVFISMMNVALTVGCVSSPRINSDHVDERQHSDEETLVGHVHHHNGDENLPETLWTVGKSEQLRQQMMAYRPEIQGRYREYFISDNLEWQKIQLPKEVVHNSSHKKVFQVNIDGQEQALIYSQTGEEEGWKFLALFSNQEDELAKEQHTYLFVIDEEQQPVVLELERLQEQIIYMKSDTAPEVQAILDLVVKEE